MREETAQSVIDTFISAFNASDDGYVTGLLPRPLPRTWFSGARGAGVRASRRWNGSCWTSGATRRGLARWCGALVVSPSRNACAAWTTLSVETSVECMENRSLMITGDWADSARSKAHSGYWSGSRPLLTVTIGVTGTHVDVASFSPFLPYGCSSVGTAAGMFFAFAAGKRSVISRQSSAIPNVTSRGPRCSPGASSPFSAWGLPLSPSECSGPAPGPLPPLSFCSLRWGSAPPRARRPRPSPCC